MNKELERKLDNIEDMYEDLKIFINMGIEGDPEFAKVVERCLDESENMDPDKLLDVLKENGIWDAIGKRKKEDPQNHSASV